MGSRATEGSDWMHAFLHDCSWQEPASRCHWGQWSTLLKSLKCIDPYTLEPDQESRQPFFCRHLSPLSSGVINTLLCLHSPLLKRLTASWKGRWSCGFVYILLYVKSVALRVSKPLFPSVSETEKIKFIHFWGNQLYQLHSENCYSKPQEPLQGNP